LIAQAIAVKVDGGDVGGIRVCQLCRNWACGRRQAHLGHEVVPGTVQPPHDERRRNFQVKHDGFAGEAGRIYGRMKALGAKPWTQLPPNRSRRWQHQVARWDVGNVSVVALS